MWDAAGEALRALGRGRNRANEIGLFSSEALDTVPTGQFRMSRSRRGFLQKAVAEVHDPVAESALVEKL